MIKLGFKVKAIFDFFWRKLTFLRLDLLEMAILVLLGVIWSQSKD